MRGGNQRTRPFLKCDSEKQFERGDGDDGALPQG